MNLSHSAGPRDVPLLAETIGDNLRRTVERFPDREALVIRHVAIVGRIKDMIIRGGENISPREIEEFLHGLPGVAEAHVIGIPSTRYGEEAMAWIKPRAGVTLTAAGLAAACRGRIATYKVPRHWRFVDDFPMTVTGKVQKYRLRELATA